MDKFRLNAAMTRAWIEAVGLQVGDTVRITRELTDAEKEATHIRSWPWNTGDELEITTLETSDYGNLQTGTRRVPYLVLEVVEKPKTVEFDIEQYCDTITVKVSSESVEIGCKKVSHDQFNQFARAFTRVKNMCSEANVGFRGMLFEDGAALSIEEVEEITNTIKAFN